MRRNCGSTSRRLRKTRWRALSALGKAQDPPETPTASPAVGWARRRRGGGGGGGRGPGEERQAGDSRREQRTRGGGRHRRRVKGCAGESGVSEARTRLFSRRKASARSLLFSDAKKQCRK